MRIVFLGTGAIGAPSLRALAKAHDVVGVISQPDRAVGRHQSETRPTPIKEVAASLGLPVFQPARLRAAEEVDAFRAMQPEIAVVVAYGQILSPEVLAVPERGCLNVHASLLPRHRGASPIQAAILSGDPTTGVTIMQMDAGLDTGAMLGRVETPVGRHETAGELHDRLGELAPEPLLAVLAEIEAGTSRSEPQDDALATYARKIAKVDGVIDWRRPATDIARLVRAYHPWPCASTTFSQMGKQTVLKVHCALPIRTPREAGPGTVLRADARGILVAAGEGAVLLREVQAAGSRRMAAAEFLRGRSLMAGEKLG